MTYDRYGDGSEDHMPDEVWSAEQRHAHSVAQCSFCDDNGYRGSTPCDHRDYASIAARGMAKFREALRKAEK